MLTTLLLFVGIATSKQYLGDLEAWDNIVKTHLHGGTKDGIFTHLVDYDGVAADPNFKKYLDSLANVKLPESCITSESLDCMGTSFSFNETYVLLINAYNAFAIKSILDSPCFVDKLGMCSGPVQGITNITNVWDRPCSVIGGRKWSLNQVEFRLRDPKPYDEDCRVHATIVCDGVSCPSLRMKAYTLANLEEGMQEALTQMVGNKKKGMFLNKETYTITFSKIYFWFVKDFVPKFAPTIVDFMIPFMPAEYKSFVMENKDKIKLEYFDYDWNLNWNEPAPCHCKEPTTH